MEVERVSDDGDDVEMGMAARTRNRKRRREADSEYNEDNVVDVDGDESDQDAPMDDLEPEHLDLEEDSTAKKKKASQTNQTFSRRHRTEVDEANLSGDEQEATVFIDNLPNDEQGIKSMLMQVRKTILEMEVQFLLEEHDNPDEDERMLEQMRAKMGQLSLTNKNEEEKEVAPNYINAKQFWCIPLSVNVTSFDFERLHQA